MVLVYLNIGPYFALVRGQVVYHHLLENLGRRRLHLALVHPFEIINVSNLAGLCDAADAVAEALEGVVLQCVSTAVGHAAEHEGRADGRPRPSLPRIAVKEDDVLGIGSEELVDRVHDLDQHVHWRRMMVAPALAFLYLWMTSPPKYPIVEQSVVVLSSAQVVYSVRVRMNLG